MWQQKQKAAVGCRTLKAKGGSQNGSGRVQQKVESRRQNAAEAEGDRRQNKAIGGKAKTDRKLQKAALGGKMQKGRGKLQEERGRSRQNADNGKRLTYEAEWRRQLNAPEGRRQAIEGGRRQKKTEVLQKAECGSRWVVESSGRYETEGDRSLKQAATVIWISMNLPRIGTL